MRSENSQLQSMGKGRMANLELLRAVSMLLVAALHFLGKGGRLPGMTQNWLGGSGYLAWALEALAIVAVNVYMLMSGYFLAESQFKPKRLLQLLLQIWFYSVGIGLLAGAFGYLPEGGFTLHYLLLLFFPVSMEHYWFMTAYVFMYGFAPLLAAGIRRLDKRQLQTVLAVLLFLFSGIKSLVPVRLDTDTNGYNCIWYLCVFVTAAYIRRYGIPFFKNKTRSLAVYLAAAACIFGGTMALRGIYQRTGRLENILTVCYEYNHILVLLASVAFFYLFYHIRLGEGLFSRLVCRVAPYTLGVYLWHEHIAIRYEWPGWFYQLAGQAGNGWSLLWQLPLAVILVFVIGILLDMLRALCFTLVHRLLSLTGLYRRLLQWLDTLRVGPEKDSVYE